MSLICKSNVYDHSPPPSSHLLRPISPLTLSTDSSEFSVFVASDSVAAELVNFSIASNTCACDRRSGTCDLDRRSSTGALNKRSGTCAFDRRSGTADRSSIYNYRCRANIHVHVYDIVNSYTRSNFFIAFANTSVDEPVAQCQSTPALTSTARNRSSAPQTLAETCTRPSSSSSSSSGRT